MDLPTPIHSLPAELLLEIFHDAIRDDDSLHRLVAMSLATTCAEVCCAWRALTLNTPTLWTKIILADAAPQVSLARARVHVKRSGNRLLTIHRYGDLYSSAAVARDADIHSDADSDDDGILDPDLWTRLVDDIVLQQFHRCESFSYTGMACKENLVHIAALIGQGAAHLHTLRLGRYPNGQVVLSPAALRRVQADVLFPALRRVDVRVCMPYIALRSPALESVNIRHTDISQRNRCQHDDFGGLASRLLPILRTATSLHDVAFGLSRDDEYDAMDRLDLQDVFRHSTLQAVCIRHLAIRWPSPDALASLHLPRLTHLTLSGWITQPGTVQDTLDVESLASLLAATPALEILSLSHWGADPALSQSNSSVKRVDMRFLNMIALKHCHKDLAPLVRRTLVLPHSTKIRISPSDAQRITDALMDV